MRIKITGYINASDLNPAHVDEAHESGLSEGGYDALSAEYEDLSDLSIEKVKD